MKTFSKKPGEERTRPVDCPACGGSEKTPYVRSEGSVFVRCRGCGLLYQDPQPQHEDLSQRYDSEYFDYEIRNEEAFYKLMRLGLRDVGFETLTGDLGQPRRFLDVGCATGRLISALSDEGWETSGVELCPWSAAYGRTERNLAIHTGTLEDASFPAESFEVVHASHLIEHLTGPVEFLREIHRVLVPGGYCILVTPNTAGFQARLFREHWRSLIPDHVCLFSVDTLASLLGREGFTVLRRKTWGGLGAGTAPRPIKYLFDRAAKLFGFGDVMIILSIKA